MYHIKNGKWNMKKLKKGYVQVYTGKGKGKTTAAIGLAVRAAGADLKVFILQFIKTGEYSEIKSLRRFSENITIEQFGRGRFEGEPECGDIVLAQDGLERVKDVVRSGEYDVVILEEANVAVMKGLLPEESLLEIIALRPPAVELVITGRGATEKVIEKADLVTEMSPVKHYFEKGIKARVGIEK